MERYELDSSGQWWCYTKRNRVRAAVRTCEQCQADFPNRHPQRFCSAKCRVDSTRGVVRRPPSKCEWCKAEFLQPPRKRHKTCSRRCAYDLGNSKRGLPGDRNPNWRGGVAPHGTSGYIRQYVPGRGQDLQHRVVMEQVLGRPLVKGENVHHKNGIRHDNRPENLELWITKQPPGQRAPEQRHCETCTCST